MEQGVRIEEGDRGQDEETQGETQTRNGFGFPQHLREREKEREKNVVGDQTKQQKKERGDTNIKANKGQVLKGTNPNIIPTPETQNAIQTDQTNILKTPNNKVTHQSNKVSEDLSQQGGGAHGPPCTFGESPQGTAVPRGTSTPPLREPPPVAQKRITIPTQDDDPKRYVLALSQSSLGKHTPYTIRKEGHHTEADRNRQDSECSLTQPKHINCWRTVVRGRREEAARPILPPKRSQIASDLRFAIRITNRNRSQIDDPSKYCKTKENSHRLFHKTCHFPKLF